jgi:hypothetical protein
LKGFFPSNQIEVFMRQMSRALLLAFLVVLGAPMVCRAQEPASIGFWVAGELGYGSASLNSDVSSHSSGGLSMGLEGGYAPNRTWSVGLRLSGCTLEASNLWDPSKGESVSLFSAMVRVYPMPGQGLFLRGGAGSLRYTNNHPLEFDGRGTGLFLGAGYEFPLSNHLRIAPVVDYTWGRLDDVNNALMTIRDRRCKLISFGVSLKFS